MEDIIAFFFRLFCVLGEMLLHLFSSARMASLIRLPGMLLYKIIWPPNWFSKMEDDGLTFYIFGVIFYILLGLYLGFYCCNDE